MNAFILIMLVSGGQGITVVQVEFNSYQSCEKARKWLYTEADKRMNSDVIAQGCFKK